MDTPLCFGNAWPVADWTAAIDELEKELEASGTKPEQSERLCELAASSRM